MIFFFISIWLCSFDLDKFQIEFWIHMIEKFSLGGFVHTLASETQRQSPAHERRLELLTLCGLRHLKSDPPITSDGSDMERCFFCCCCFKRWCSNPHSTMITIPPRILWLTAITTSRKFNWKGCVIFNKLTNWIPTRFLAILNHIHSSLFTRISILVCERLRNF